MKLTHTIITISVIGISAVLLLTFYGNEMDAISREFTVVQAHHTNRAQVLQAHIELSPTPARSLASKTGMILHEVPFTVQAPFGEWDDARLKDGCEEASAIMITHWLRGKTSIAPYYAKNHIIALSDWQQDVYGTFHDTSTHDTLDRIIKEYFKYDNAFVKEDVSTADDIVVELENNSVVMAPVNGQVLKNKFYSGLGPPRHMITIIGYDYDTKEFIANDPGTRSGANYRYPADRLLTALKEYGTGKFQDLEHVEKNIIVVRKAAPTLAASQGLEPQ